MAQQVKLMGAIYSDVPSVRLPDANDDLHTFVDTSDANATQNSLLEGATAYVNGSKLTGAVTIVTYYTGSSAPSSSLGSDGDIYLRTS